MIRLELPEPPTANNWWRYRRGQKGKHGHGQMYLSADARAYKEAVSMLTGRYRENGKAAFPSGTEVSLSVFWRRTARKSPTGGLFYSGDLDKRLGVLLDALQSSVYDNDNQVVELHAYRLDAPPGALGSVTVEVKEYQ